MLSSKFEVKVGGEDRTIFMSFGLLTALSNHLDSPRNAANVILDPVLREATLKELFATRKAGGKIIVPCEDPEDLDVSVEQMEQLLNWVSEHVLSFFVRSLKRSKELIDPVEKDLVSLQSSPPGSTVSASETP